MMHVNEIKKERRLIIGGQFPHSWAKMKESASIILTFHNWNAELICLITKNEQIKNKKQKCTYMIKGC